ncbi:MAG: hypothetical protein AB1730_14070 [Myxococcota bacterium]|jgi:hypothetical protein
MRCLAFTLASLVFTVGCSPSTSQRVAAVKESFFELTLDGERIRLDHAAEHGGRHVFRASGPLTATGRVQLWLAIDAPAQRIIPYGSDGSERLSRSWHVMLAKGTRVYSSPVHAAIGATVGGDQGTLRITQDGLVTEGTFSTPVTLVGDRSQTIELVDVRFRFYKTRYLDHVGDSALRGGMFTGPVEGVPNLFSGPEVGKRDDPVSKAIMSLQPAQLRGIWQHYRSDIIEPTYGHNMRQEPIEPGTFIDFHAAGPPVIRHTESNQIFQSEAIATGNHIIYYFREPDDFVIYDNHAGFMNYYERVVAAP